MLESSTSMKPKASNFSDVEMSSLCLSRDGGKHVQLGRYFYIIHESYICVCILL